ncbi:hypothetical protein [Aliterella atlantica]|uniref:hypothetical protein n=1 Tax=Aliterella atlantica TaxID=1827278 RepID=UPI001364D648|nr:hypothetical protein [Aliterella atlantica]
MQQRAKHLGVEISADRRMKIEMWANESYKERYGQNPRISCIEECKLLFIQPRM